MDNLFFFGRFNFPHYGYLYVIREGLRQIHPANGITLIPSIENATWGKTAISYTHRHTMLTLAFKELAQSLQSQIHISPIEYALKDKLHDAYGGYTIDTLRALLSDRTGSAGIIMGADAMLGIPDTHAGFTAWKNWDEIQKKVALVTLPRGRYKTASEIQRFLPPDLHPQILSTTPTELELHASSTAIQNGNHDFLPDSVYKYALSHGLLIQ